MITLENILFICTGNIDRSPTAEALLEKEPGYEVRSAGTMSGARRRVSKQDIEWADRILVMEEHHRRHLLGIEPGAESKIRVLEIPDIYRRGDPRLVEILRTKLASKGINL